MLSSRAQWGPNLAALSRVCRPVVVELLGHGRSGAPETAASYRPDAYVEEFERIRTALCCERWLLCGQSLGAALTLRYALRHPERVAAQIFTNSNSALATADWTEAQRPAMEAFAMKLDAEGTAPLERLPVHPRHSRRLDADVKAALVEDSQLLSPRGVGHTAVQTVLGSSVREEVTELAVPTLLVHGTREKRFARHAQYAADTISGLEVVELAGGHAINLEARKGFEAAACTFVATHAGSASS